MKRREFLCGLSGVVAGLAMSELRYFGQDNRKKHQIPQFGVVLTSHCNLNCKSCDTFAPISREWYMSPKLFFNDMKKLKQLYNVNTWKGCFTGGEPLLHPDLEKIIEKTFYIFPSAQVEILTNGTLLNDKDDKFWRLLQKYGVKLVISEYPINIDRKKYEEKIKKYNIPLKRKVITSHKLYDIESKKVIDYDYKCKGNTLWGKPKVDLIGSQSHKEKYYACPNKGHHVYKGGGLYACYFHSNIEEFGRYFNVGIDFRDAKFNDYLQIGDVKTKEEIQDFLDRPNPICRYCKYCHSSCHGKGAIDWDFSTKDIYEWT